MYNKLTLCIILLCSIALSQTISTNFSQSTLEKDLPLLYLSKNRIPHNLSSSFLSNIRYSQFNKKQNLLFVSNIFITDKEIKLFEVGVKYNFKSNQLILGMIDDKNNETLSLNEHIIFGNNHEPIKRLTIQSNDYMLFPWGKDSSFWKNIFFSYNFTHGILDKNHTYFWNEYYGRQLREIYYSEAPFLHRKQLHIKINIKESLNLKIGFNHAALWGGTLVNLYTNTTKKYSNDFDSFYRTVFWKGGTKAYDRNDIVGGVIGNHLGSIDFAVIKKSKKIKTTYYYQHIFEDGGSFWFDNKFDGLWGINLKNNNLDSLLNEVTLEFLNTKHQSGNIHPDGVDSYFWHDQYPAGWQYKGVSIGSLFINPSQNRSQIYFLSTRVKIKENLTFDSHIGYGKIYHYYGFKDWHIPIDTYFENDYQGKYKSIFLSLNSKTKNNIEIKYDIALEKNLESETIKFFNIKISKYFLLY